MTRRSSNSDGGYIMVVLLISMAVAAVWATALLPAWKQQDTREKEAELLFRGTQYARAIELFKRKNNNALPPDVNTLVMGKYLRKKWKDPITGKDFILQMGQNQQGVYGITKVQAPSTATSIKVVTQQQTYDAWDFQTAYLQDPIYVANNRAAQQQQGNQPGRNGQGGPGGTPGRNPGGGPGGPPNGGPAGAPGRTGPGGPGGTPPVGAPGRGPGGRGGF